MIKTAVYPGSFKPWHDGHEDVLKKALQVFDHIILARGINPAKDFLASAFPFYLKNRYGNKISFTTYDILLTDFVTANTGISAVVRGLRNGQDFESEKTMQYWNEDLGLTVPTIYFITDRKLVHMSSTALRQLETFNKE